MSNETDPPVTVDLSLALAPRVSGGVAPERIVEHPRAADAVPAVLRAAEDGTLGFWDLPDDDETPRACKERALALREHYDTLVVLGIGGSSLGGRALVDALSPGRTRVVFVDNVDPHRFEATLRDVDLERTAFNVVSKSGGTVETAAQFVCVRDRLKKEYGDKGYAQRVVATTDPEQGLMHDVAKADGLAMLPVPHNVGGRFSALTAVGLLPAAFAGLDVGGLRQGAAAMRERCTEPAPQQNPALALACLHHLADVEDGKPNHVMMPYSDRLRPFAEWFCQLWGESLGKAKNRAGDDVHVGPTPIVAVGSTDQHSQIQLYVEGPADKVVTFLRVEDHGETTPFPDDTPDGYTYLRGHTMAGLLDAEQRGTQLALARLGRPTVTVSVPRVDERSLGGLMFLYEAATAFAGELYDINAFDQPGVEMGKKIAFALMGRDGYEDALRGLEDLKDSHPDWVLGG